MNALETLQRTLHEDAPEEWSLIRKYIASHPDVMDGLPVFAGTRVPVYIILDYLSQGFPVDAIRKDYPQLSAEMITATLKFAGMLAAIH